MPRRFMWPRVAHCCEGHRPWSRQPQERAFMAWLPAPLLSLVSQSDPIGLPTKAAQTLRKQEG